MSGDELLEQWDRKVHSDRLPFKFSGCYFKLEGCDGVFKEGSDDETGTASDVGADTPCILTSCTKVFAGTAVMRTMHLKPRDWYPEKAMHEFEGWESWRDFPVYDNEATTDGKPNWSGKYSPAVTVHQLLTHTSGWPFGLRGKRERILNMPLYFEPGTNFGYSIGHRILGWMLLDYWKAQPEGREFTRLNDVFDFLIYKPLGMSGTKFIEDKFEQPHSVMGEFFSMKYFDNPENDGDDDPADLALASTGSDMSKLAMMALRRGRLEDGSVYIRKWDEWAGKNQLPGGKLSSALAHWRMEGHDDINFLWRTMVTRTVNSGPFGWSYFGGTYHDCPADCAGDAGPVIAVGWKGFSSCGLRADYQQGVAFTVMQECVPDPGNRNFSECVHEGKAGDFKLIEVAKRLASADSSELDSLRETYPKKTHPVHNFMAEDNAGCLGCVLKMFLRCGYFTALPCGVKVLKFHKSEQLGPEKVMGQS